MRLRFKELQQFGQGLNAVVQKESKGYSVYSNDFFYEDECDTLVDVYESLCELKDRLDKLQTVKYNGIVRQVEILQVESQPASGLPYMKVYDLHRHDFRTFTLSKIGL